MSVKDFRNDNYRETSVNYLTCDDFLVVSTNERKWISKINSLKEKFPNDVIIKSQSEDSIVAHMPKSFFKFPSPKKEMSEENKLKAAERMREYQESKKG